MPIQSAKKGAKHPYRKKRPAKALWSKVKKKVTTKGRRKKRTLKHKGKKLKPAAPRNSLWSKVKKMTIKGRPKKRTKKTALKIRFATHWPKVKKVLALKKALAQRKTLSRRRKEERGKAKALWSKVNKMRCPRSGGKKRAKPKGKKCESLVQKPKEVKPKRKELKEMPFWQRRRLQRKDLIVKHGSHRSLSLNVDTSSLQLDEDHDLNLLQNLKRELSCIKKSYARRCSAPAVSSPYKKAVVLRSKMNSLRPQHGTQRDLMAQSDEDQGLPLRLVQYTDRNGSTREVVGRIQQLNILSFPTILDPTGHGEITEEGHGLKFTFICGEGEDGKDSRRASSAMLLCKDENNSMFFLESQIQYVPHLGFTMTLSLGFPEMPELKAVFQSQSQWKLPQSTFAEWMQSVQSEGTCSCSVSQDGEKHLDGGMTPKASLA